MTQRSDLAAALAAGALLAELAFAQVTLVLTICFVIAGRLSRWRPVWLAVPGAAGLAWLLAVDVRPGLAGYVAAGGQMVKLLGRPGSLPARIAALRYALAGWRGWLPRQLPVALITAAAQAAVATLPGRAPRRWSYRRGWLVAAKSRYLLATLRRGEIATPDGCCVGVIEQTGSRAEISWQEAEAGVLCTGQDASAVLATGLDLAVGAIQHRKTVIIIDLAGGAGDPIASACAATAAPLRRYSWQDASYDPLAGAAPARATSLTMAMINWAGVAPVRQLFCQNYLNVAFALLAAGNSQRAHGGRPVLDELGLLMTPAALRARFAQLNGRHPSIGSLAGRVAELCVQLEADRSTLAPLAAQLADYGSTAPGHPVLLRPDHAARTQPPAPPINLARALAGRQVVHFPLDRRALGRAAVMTARLVAADLIEVLAERSDIGDRTDCLVWINGCEVLDHRQLAVLVALGDRTGTAVVLGTAHGPAAAALVADVNVVAVRGLGPAELRRRPPDRADEASTGELAAALAEFHAPGCVDALSIQVRGPRTRLVPGCKATR